MSEIEGNTRGVRSARIVDKQTTHDSRGRGEKMLPVVPLPAFRSQKPKESFVHNSSRLQRVIRSFPPHMDRCNVMQFLLDRLHQLVCSRFVTFGREMQEFSDLLTSRCALRIDHVRQYAMRARKSANAQSKELNGSPIRIATSLVGTLR